MTSGRFSSLITSALLLNFLLIGTASAFWGFGGDDNGKSGLDLNGGYDVNTVTTVRGRAVSIPNNAEKGNVIIEINSGAEIVNVYVGPSTYWEKNAIAVHINDDISAKGSKAQGKDGKTYLLSQKLVNRTTGAQVELRNEKGDGAWTGATTRMDNGQMNQGGNMMRGGGNIMRGGGGGMMRH